VTTVTPEAQAQYDAVLAAHGIVDRRKEMMREIKEAATNEERREIMDRLVAHHREIVAVLSKEVRDMRDKIALKVANLGYEMLFREIAKKFEGQ